MITKRHTSILSTTIKDIYDRVDMNKAAAIILDGSLGEGKTTEAVNVADEFNELAGFPPIKFEEQLALGGNDFIKKIKICYERQYPVVIYDEAGDYSKKGAMSHFNKAISNVFETFRAYRLIVILCLPYFNSLDNSIFKHNAVRLLLHCHDRTRTYGNIRAYGIDEMGWLRYYMDRFKHREYVAYSKVMPNFRACFHNLDEQRCKTLDAYCTKGKLNILSKAGVKMNNLTDVNELSYKLQRSKDWVRQTLLRLNIKPEMRLGNTKYHNKDVYDRLKRELKR